MHRRTSGGDHLVVPGLQLKLAEFAFCVHDPATSCTNVFVHFPNLPDQIKTLGNSLILIFNLFCFE
jgi:hypothetical protein